MQERDRDLGMNSDITRRDFLDGVAYVAGATALAGVAGATQASAGETGADYPPMRQGMRGFTDEAMAAGHAVRDGAVQGEPADTGEVYDLVIVGAGMAGLSAAYFYHKQYPKAKVLILEGCDDFGGHARRVEFDVNGRQLITNGGTVGLWYPGTFSPEAATLLSDIGVDRERYYKQAAADVNPVNALGLKQGRFFNREVYRRDTLVADWISWDDPKALRAALDRSPLKAHEKAGFLEYYAGKTDYMPGVAVEEKVRRLRAMTYFDYLTKVAGLPPVVVGTVQAQEGPDNSNQGAGPDTYSAWFAYRRGLPGFAGLGLPQAAQPRTDLTQDAGEHIFFPDGNAGVARLLVRWLIPDALPGSTMEDSVPLHVNYDTLDQPANTTRIRLSSMVTGVKHLGAPAAAREVEVSYVRAGKAYRVRGKACVLACFNAIIPYLVPELPETQKAALHMAVRKPLVYSRVAIRNWKAFQKLDVWRISCPEMDYHTVSLEARPCFGWFPSAWGSVYAGPQTPDDPIIVNMELSASVVEMHGSGLPPREQWKAARAKLQAISFETMERNIRLQLNRVLGPGGFDAKRDIVGITISRWGHGYATGSNELYDPDWSHRTDAPWVVGRQRFGRIAISNSDAAATSLTNAAFAQSHRAVNEIINDVVRPTYDFHFSERDTRGINGAWPDII
jgi:spermidine dehydrogenase